MSDFSTTAVQVQAGGWGSSRVETTSAKTTGVTVIVFERFFMVRSRQAG